VFCHHTQLEPVLALLELAAQPQSHVVTPIYLRTGRAVEIVMRLRRREDPSPPPIFVWGGGGGAGGGDKKHKGKCHQCINPIYLGPTPFPHSLPNPLRQPYPTRLPSLIYLNERRNRRHIEWLIRRLHAALRLLQTVGLGGPCRNSREKQVIRWEHLNVEAGRLGA
jgi:hypothetical protein